MTDAIAVLEKCHKLGVKLMPLGDRLKVKTPHPLPEDLLLELRITKTEVIALLKRERDHEFKCWVLEEWRRVSIPTWRRILITSIETENKYPEEYARWMLREILEDPVYE